MSNTTANYNRAALNVKWQLNPESIPTFEEVKEVVDLVCKLPKFSSLNKTKLIDLIQKEINISYSGEGILDSKNDDHIKWLFENGATINKDRKIDWTFWKHYKEHLYDNLPVSAIDNIDSLTNKILMRLEDPKRNSVWSRKGMVVGEVQSGKTGNYTGLICKAADAGYKVIVVFAGLHKSLRAQTQQRLDESFVGFNTDKDDKKYEESFRMGVGLNKNHPPVVYLTTSNDSGDFSKTIAQGTGVPFGETPIILVVKKNKSIIENLLLWAKRMGIRGNQKTIKKVPLLVIDDECDNASVNTSKFNILGEEDLPVDEYGEKVPEFDPTAINRGIRSLLKLFEQKAYVGYTATPFANVLIHRQSFHSEYGEDLFPKNFIIGLPKPSTYIGPSKFFGLEGDDQLGIERIEPYPLFRKITDASTFVPSKHKSDHRIQEDLPLSLKTAILSFILSCACRIARGQETKHNTMLIHVTRFTAVQNQLAELVQEYIDRIDKRLRLGEGESDSTWELLERIYEEDYIQNTAMKMPEKIEVTPFPLVRAQVVRALEKLQQVKQINGTAGDILEYKSYKDIGINVIAIGGDKLSRGLTLEGLTISYYLRSSKLYDTLLQMGRWFGYRPDYLDLCRLYTTGELYKWYRHIALATAELKKEFDYMVENDEEPISFGLKVRSHPDALSVTSLGKMRSGEKMKVTYDGYMAQTLNCTNLPEKLETNFLLLKEMISSLKWEKETVGYKSVDCEASLITDFITSIYIPKSNLRFQPTSLCSYIKMMNRYQELTSWTIVILSPKTGRVLKGMDTDLELRLTERNSNVYANSEEVSFGKAILSPSHEKIDLTGPELEKIKKETPKEIRKARSPKRGLMLIYALEGHTSEGVDYGRGKYPVLGLVLSFPQSNNSQEIEYVVDALYAENLNSQ